MRDQSLIFYLKLKYQHLIFLLLLIFTTAGSAQQGLWTSATELSTLPTSGPAWEAVLNAADNANPNKAKVDDKDSDNNVEILAAAIVYARTGEDSYKEKVLDAIEVLVEKGKPNGRTLEWAREAGAYALAADLVGHRSAGFDRWCKKIAREWNADDDKTMLEMYLQRPNNWGSMGFGSLAALFAYLGDEEGLTAVRDHWVQLVEGPKPESTEYDEDDMSWHADEDDPRIINPLGSEKDGMNIDGVIPDDLRRGGSFREPPRQSGYPWEHMQGIMMAARIFDRMGMSIWTVGDHAIFRAAYCLQVRFENAYGNWAAEVDDEWMIPFLDAAYGSHWINDYDQESSLIWHHGKNAGWAYVALAELGGSVPTFYQLTTSSNGSGTIALDPVGASYEAGTQVTLTAAPENGWEFSHWEGDANGENNPQIITINANKAVTAVFTEIPAVYHTITLTIQGNGNIDTDPAPESEDGATLTFREGTEVTFTARPDNRWGFSGWNGDVSSQENPLTIVIQSDLNLTLLLEELPPQQYALSVHTLGEGSVTLDPLPVAGIDGEYVYNEGTVVTATAIPAGSSQFSGWLGDLSGYDATTSFTINSNSSITAAFSDPEAGGSARFQETQVGGSSNAAFVQTNSNITAIPGNLYLAVITTKQFAEASSVHGLGLNWSLVKSQCAGREQTGVEIWMALGSPESDDIVTAVFDQPVRNAALAVMRYSGVDVINPIGAVTSANTNGFEGDCSNGVDNAEFELNLNTTSRGSAVMSAVAHRHKSASITDDFNVIASEKQGSGGNAAGLTVFDRYVVLPSPISISGEFSGTVDWAAILLEIRPGGISTTNFSLETETTGEGFVIADPQQDAYPAGSTVSLSATAVPGWEFSGWAGDLSGNTTPVDLVMFSDKVVIAQFTPKPADSYTLTTYVSGAGLISLDPELDHYSEGTTVNALATAATGYNFSGWSGDASGYENPAVISMTSDKEITAFFTPASENEILHRETVSGGSRNSKFVSTNAEVKKGGNDLYIAAISTKTFREAVSVEGLGLNWQHVKTQCSGRSQTGIQIWVAHGIASRDGAVTALLKKEPSNAVISVTRYSGVNPSEPFRVAVYGNTNGLNGDCKYGVDSESYAFGFQTGVEKTIVYNAIAQRQRTHTAGEGFNERSQTTQGSSGSAAGLTVTDKYIGHIGSTGIAGTFNRNVDWAVVSLQLFSQTPGENTLQANQPDGSGDAPAESNMVPEKVVLNENYPNPFNPETTIRFSLPDAMAVRLMVYNNIGQQVRQLIFGYQSAGHHQVVWDGRNDRGFKVSSGIYFLRLYAGEQSFVRRMILQK